MITLHVVVSRSPTFISNSQVRAGLTPKYKDVDNLVGMLTYTMGGPSIDAGGICRENSRVLRYTPPVPEFEVMMMTIEPGETLTLDNPKVPSVLIAVEGAGKIDGIDVRPGRSYYWAGDASDLVLEVADTRRGPLKIAVAHKNCHMSHPTAVNRDPFARPSHQISVTSSPMPYQGLGSATPPVRSFVPEADPKFFEHTIPTLQ